MRFASRWLNYAVAFAIFVLTVYRAITLSLTVDEASTYVEYVHNGWPGVFHGRFDANNHILYSILEKFSRQLFGMSEFSLRIPVLLGAALFLWSVARLCSKLVPGLWFSLLSFLIITANPLMLDFMVAARGYGLALGLFAFALLQLIEWLEDRRPSKIAIAGIALGLTSSANLMFAFAAIAAFCVGALLLLLRRQFKIIPLLILPAVAIPILLWRPYFQAYDKGVFYFGTTAIYECLDSVEGALFKHDLTRGDPFVNWSTTFFLRYWILPYLIPILWASIFVWMRRRANQGLAFAMLVFAVSCFGMWLAHTWLGILYPEERTALAFVFLFLLTWTAAIGVWWNANRYTRWLLGFPNLLLAFVFLFQFAGQFDPSYLGPWRVNWKMHQVMSELRGHQGRLRTHWIYQSTAEYYRLRWKIPIETIVREQDTFPLDNADYFLVPIETQEQLDAIHMRILYRDEVTGTTLFAK